MNGGLFMNYIEVTTEEAIEILRKAPGKKVMVAIQNLESDEPVAFCPRLKKDCELMIEEAATIAQKCDDFVKQLKLFTEEQDISHIINSGIQKTILFK